MPQSKGIWRKIVVLGVVGGLVFFAISIAISLLPIAADYRVAESISNIQAVWVGGLLVGLIIGFFVSFFLLRFFDKIPTNNPILKSVVLSFIAFVIAMILLEAPASFRTSDVLYYLLIGVIFNVPRFLFCWNSYWLSIQRLYKGSNPAVVTSKAP